MTATPNRISDVVACNLCTGCGACAGLFPNAIRMIEDELAGRRPVVANEDADTAAMAVCAGAAVEKPAVKDAIDDEWGPVRATWEGYAADTEIHFRGSSGGAVTALAQFALEQGFVSGVAHVAASKTDARVNEAVISRDRAGLVRGSGSRYAQASPAELLREIAASDTPMAFIGKPCDIASAHKAAQQSPGLAQNLGLTIGIFCAGAPNLNATTRLLDHLDVPRDVKVTDLRYRGNGWPGLMQATYETATGEEITTRGIPYSEGWGTILQTGRGWRCRICDDHTAAFADISVGDPWHNPPKGNTDAGRSLIIARTKRGEELIRAAIAAGVLVAEEKSRDVIALAQPNLVATNAAVWGRRKAMQLVGMPVPQGQIGASFGRWLRLSAKERAQSFAGTLKRIWRNKLWRPVKISGVEAAQ
ncbi:MAG: Coenzyme F420 hydrogenase/dehydrogenase, beta subunit C-terminal domain [Pseudomonadota bacterium]